MNLKTDFRTLPHKFWYESNGDDMIDLSNQIALVTGGSRGIGATTAVLLAKAGANVAITYRAKKQSAQDIVRKIREIGKMGIAFQCNVESMNSCKKVIKNLKREFGKIDILVNSAGIWEYGPIAMMTPKKWERTISINLTGTFNMCHLVVPIMKHQKRGRIINVSSTAGQRGEPFYSHYASSKGGIIAFTKSIAVELIRYGIWVNCVAPGWVDTDMTSHIFKNPRSRRKIIESIPRRKIATPDEIAGPIVFLASDLSNNIIGEILNVNGGSVLCG